MHNTIKYCNAHELYFKLTEHYKAVDPLFLTPQQKSWLISDHPEIRGNKPDLDFLILKLEYHASIT